MRHQESDTGEQLAVGLGWFSLGLGMAEVAAPGGLARLIGLRNGRSEATLRAFGAREVGNGLAILADPERAAWMWSRVGGDALDLAFLAGQLRRNADARGRIMSTMAAVAGVTAVDLACAIRLSKGANRGAGRGVRVERVVTINRPIREVYAFWRTFENFPRFMRHLESVESISRRRSRWRAKAPAGTTVEWEAEILQDRENEWIAWRSVEGSQIDNSGSVRFQAAPGHRGTELRVQLQYSPPAGAAGRLIAKLFGEEPDQQVREDLHRFKQLMETGEVAISDGPSLSRPARPPADAAELRGYAGVH